MWLVAAKNLAGEHARQNDVIGKLRLAGAFGTRINLAKRLADYVQLLDTICHKSNQPRMNADTRGSEVRERNLVCPCFKSAFICVQLRLIPIPIHTNFRVAVPSAHHASSPPPTRLLRKS